MTVLPIPGHRYHGYETRNDPDRWFMSVAWRWICQCGAHGRWQYQSDSGCEPAHRKHAERTVRT